MCRVVNWKVSDPSWVKVNTNEASKGKPDINCYGFCLRNEFGNLIYV